MADESFDQACPQCQTRYRIGPAHYGKRVRCAKCGSEFRADIGPPPEPPPFAPEPPPFAPPHGFDPATKPCPFCAERIAANAIKCRFCGSMLVPIQGHSDRKVIRPKRTPHDPLLMGFLSGCCIAGLGQIIMGQATKGIICLLGAMALAVVTAGVSILITWPAFGIDAYMVAKKLKSGQPVGEWEFFPS